MRPAEGAEEFARLTLEACAGAWPAMGQAARARVQADFVWSTISRWCTACCRPIASRLRRVTDSRDARNSPHRWWCISSTRWVPAELRQRVVNIINRDCRNVTATRLCALTERQQSRCERITAPAVAVIELHKRPGYDLGLYWRLWKTLRTLRHHRAHAQPRHAGDAVCRGAAARCKAGARRARGGRLRPARLQPKSNNLLRKAARLVVQRYIAVSKDLEH